MDSFLHFLAYAGASAVALIAGFLRLIRPEPRLFSSEVPAEPKGFWRYVWSEQTRWLPSLALLAVTFFVGVDAYVWQQIHEWKLKNHVEYENPVDLSLIDWASVFCAFVAALSLGEADKEDADRQTKPCDPKLTLALGLFTVYSLLVVCYWGILQHGNQQHARYLARWSAIIMEPRFEGLDEFDPKRLKHHALTNALNMKVLHYAAYTNVLYAFDKAVEARGFIYDQFAKMSENDPDPQEKMVKLTAIAAEVLYGACAAIGLVLCVTTSLQSNKWRSYPWWFTFLGLLLAGFSYLFFIRSGKVALYFITGWVLIFLFGLIVLRLNKKRAIPSAHKAATVGLPRDLQTQRKALKPDKRRRETSGVGWLVAALFVLVVLGLNKKRMNPSANKTRTVHHTRGQKQSSLD
jgi:hypothetical protein